MSLSAEHWKRKGQGLLTQPLEQPLWWNRRVPSFGVLAPGDSHCNYCPATSRLLVAGTWGTRGENRNQVVLLNLSKSSLSISCLFFKLRTESVSTSLCVLRCSVLGSGVSSVEVSGTQHVVGALTASGSYLELWPSPQSPPLLTLQKPQTALPCIVSRSFSLPPWRPGWVCSLHLTWDQRATMEFCYFFMLFYNNVISVYTHTDLQISVTSVKDTHIW